MNANTYLNSLGIEVVEAAQAAIGRLVLAGEFVLGGERGALICPKRGDVSSRYLEILVGKGYAFVVVDSGGYPAFYAREGEGFAPVRALPIAAPQRFPSTSVLAGWAQLIRTSASPGEAARLGVAQLIARFGSDDLFGPALIRATDHVPIERLGGDNSVAAEPLRTAAALLAGFRMRPDSPDELAGLVVALSSLLPDKGQFTGLTESLAPLVRDCRFGTRRLLVSSGGGAEVAALVGAEGTIVLPSEMHLLEPLLAQLLPDVDRVFSSFLQSTFEPIYDAVIVVPPLGLQLDGTQLGRFELAKRGGKVRGRAAAEPLFVEHALAAVADGGILVVVLPEGLLSSTGHADFRHWLLEQARLLAVVSLPAGACFRATGVKCSVVLLQKAPPAHDYRILMVDVDADDMNSDIDTARSKLDEFLEREVPACE